MKKRSRSLPTPEPYLKFLKPGALAQIRDSKISARTHRFIKSLRSAPSSPSSDDLQPQVNGFSSGNGGVPCFSSRIYCGPRCPQRKKLVAAKTVLFLPSSPVPDSPDPIVNHLLNSDNIVVAH